MKNLKKLNTILDEIEMMFEMAQGPTPDRPPVAMIKKDKQLKAWKDVLKKYKNVIFKSDSVKKQWAAAVAILKNHGKKHKIQIFADVSVWDNFINDALLENEINEINLEL